MYSKNYKHIFKECKIGNITIPNRIVMAPMGAGHYGGFFDAAHVDFYGARARGEVGLVMTEDCYTDSFEDDPYPRFMPVPRFDSRIKLSRAYDVARRIKMYGSVPGIQINPGQGRNADGPYLRKRMKDFITLNRYGETERDLAPYVAFLVSEGSGYITGQTLNVDGGMLESR